MAARSLQRPTRLQVCSGLLIALLLIGGRRLLLLDGCELGESGSIGASPATPSAQLSGMGGAGSSAATPVERTATTAALGTRRGRADSHPRRNSPGAARDQRRICPVPIRTP